MDCVDCLDESDYFESYLLMVGREKGVLKESAHGSFEIFGARHIYIYVYNDFSCIS